MVKKRNIVILGAGYGGLRVAQRLSYLMTENDDYQIVLVDKNDYHTYMTQLYQQAAGTADCTAMVAPYSGLIEEHKVNFIQGCVSEIDSNNKLVKLINGEKIQFDYLVAALGSRTEYYNIPGLEENSISINSLQNAVRIQRRVEHVLKEKQKNPTFVIGGGGLTGVEYAGELAHWLGTVSEKYNINPAHIRIIMIEGSKQLLPGMSGKVADYAKDALQQQGVEVITGDFVKEVTPDTIYLSSGREINYSVFVWAGGVSGSEVLAKSGLKTEGRGRLMTNRYLQYVEDKMIYAVGDSALVINPKTGRPMIPTAQAALQHGTLVAQNIYRDILGKPLLEFRPGNILLLISVGKGRGLGESEKISFTGRIASWLKKAVPIKYKYFIGGLKMFCVQEKEKVNRHNCWQSAYKKS
ncbi:NAD(P)/FAD-dependent oxidoreductase [Desulfofalx alkaliphila]|uniref:NAD(P)/FAD-dependent oxidoreductase n=1 Tax=Desulfofalx alkaliphila TaxID=105483 RepID=UPI0004E12AB3|nr:NAD(P)/FAD-dependent oxidoreductase [Desulfofalx alkaliphila]